MRVENLIKPLTDLPKREQIKVVEAVREDRATSKASLKKTSTRQRSNASEKLTKILDAMSPEERAAFIKANL